MLEQVKLTVQIWVIALALILTGCSQVNEKVIQVAGNDLQRTSELAEKYGKPEVKVCADFLLGSLKSEDSVQVKIAELSKEDVKGLASAGLKAALLAELVRSLNDPAQRAKFESDFKTNCQAVAGAIMMNILRDARTVGSKGQF